MRELTRSMIRFSWAMPLLGMNVMTRFVSPRRDRDPLAFATETLDALSATAQAHLGPELQKTYDAGLRVQNNVVDTVLGMWPASDSCATGSSSRGVDGCR